MSYFRRIGSSGKGEARNYDIKAVNPNRKSVEDTRTPEELIALIEEQQAEIADAIRRLKEKGI